MSFWMVAFFILLALGASFGIVRDIASTETGVREATVIDNTPNQLNYHWPRSPPSIKVKLADGSVVIAATRGGTEPGNGSTVAVREMKAPWGQLWYKLTD